MSVQTDITAHMRGILINWLIEVHILFFLCIMLTSLSLSLLFPFLLQGNLINQLIRKAFWWNFSDIGYLFIHFTVLILFAAFFATAVTGTLQIWFNARNSISHGDIVRWISLTSYHKEEWTAVGWSYCTLAGIKIRRLLASQGKDQFVQITCLQIVLKCFPKYMIIWILFFIIQVKDLISISAESYRRDEMLAMVCLSSLLSIVFMFISVHLIATTQTGRVDGLECTHTW